VFDEERPVKDAQAEDANLVSRPNYKPPAGLANALDALPERPVSYWKTVVLGGNRDA